MFEKLMRTCRSISKPVAASLLAGLVMIGNISAKTISGQSGARSQQSQSANKYDDCPLAEVTCWENMKPFSCVQLAKLLKREFGTDANVPDKARTYPVQCGWQGPGMYQFPMEHVFIFSPTPYLTNEKQLENWKYAMYKKGIPDSTAKEIVDSGLLRISRRIWRPMPFAYRPGR